MSIQHVAAVLDARDERLTGSRKLVLVTLANRTDHKGECWPTQELISAECGIEVRTIADHLKALEKDGFIVRDTQHLGRGKGSRTIYRLHLGALKNAPAKIARANNAPAKNDECSGGTPHVTNLQEPTYPIANAIGERASAPPIPAEQPKRSAQPKSTARGSRIPSNWTPTPKDYAFASSEGLDREEINREADKFRDYWTATTGRSASKLDWEGTWRNWIRRVSDDRRKRAAGRTAYQRGGAEQTLSAFDRVAASLAGNAPRPADPVQSDAFTIEGQHWSAEARTGTDG
jgi:hypothetical protein